LRGEGRGGVKRRNEMTLSTFGAIMGFASEMLERALDVYQTVVEKAEDPFLKETLQGLSREEGKNHSLMEQTRRENVTEMILEPITGLHQEDYEIDVKVLDKMKDVDLLKIALILEESEKKFFHDASSRVSLPEVARIFQKIAQRKEKNLIKLKALGLNQLL
jgi:rubrerythrin